LFITINPFKEILMSKTLTSLSAKTKALSVGASILTLATVLGSAQGASAATFNFSFSNVSGPVNGTVSGTVVLPDGDGTFPATGITVTSAPAALGYTLPFDVLANLTTVLENTFTVAGGAIDTAASSFYAFFTPDNVIGSGFGLSSAAGFVSGSSFSIQLSSSPSTGVIDSDNSTLTFTPADTATTPEPGTLLGLLAVGSMGVLARKRKG
jgi:hypothetical protein